MGSKYGDWLREQREAAGLTQQQLADMAVMTRSHIAHIEAGRRVPSKEDARRLDVALNTGNVLSSFLPREEESIADYFEAVRVLEQQAVLIKEFAVAYFPGILQTERYARAILGALSPPVGEEECDRRVVTRLERAKILEDPTTPVVWALLDELLLRRPVASGGVMAEQIMHVVHLAEAGRIRAHVMPFDAGQHPLMQGMLKLMWFEDQPPLAYGETHRMGKLHDSPSVVRELQHHYDLAMSDAMPLKESLAFLRASAEEYEHHG
ncbi:helix-turn-helix domain-containing protein [Streptomyces monashensis]|uniref:Transcriptional regulator n=1 Tax=Streptomyces monashensis TaxID=1678012 RepID=A0A1S2Q3X7_9ACTN|nr:helix-turn-helix transcriptional regulator [Streptomyces monashensis]OIK00276.1 transcriptional regulator [Streptomyces monashensis]